MKKKILLLEDDQGQFRRMNTKLTKYLGDSVDIFPKENGKSGTFENYSHLITQAQKSEFKEILNHYTDVDIFIIDNSLKNTDHLGSEFRNYIKKSNYQQGSYFIFLLTNTAEQWLTIKDWDISKEKYVPKTSHNFEIGTYILAEVADFLKVDLEEKYDELATPEEKEELKDVLESRNDEVVAVKRQRFIHKFIITSFYILLFITALNATINVTLEFGGSTIANTIKFLEKSHLKAVPKKTPEANIDTNHSNNAPTNNSSENVTKKTEETNALETVESIYIYILPFLIVFGFYNYYVSSASISLLGGHADMIKPHEATRTMKMTKVLFISSMISYVVIKLIEILFNGDPSVKTLISSGILILILMSYFIYLEFEGKE